MPRRRGIGRRTNKTQEDSIEAEPQSCWICLAEGGPEEFISPCRCSGTMGRVHEDCLVQWLRHKMVKDGLHQPRCPNCKAIYVVVKESDDDIEEVPIEDQNYVSKLFFVLRSIWNLPSGEERSDLLAFYTQFLFLLIPSIYLSAATVFVVTSYWANGAGPPATYELFQASRQSGHSASWLAAPGNAIIFFICGFVPDNNFATPPENLTQTGLHPSGLSEGWFHVNVFLNTCKANACLYITIICFMQSIDIAVDVGIGRYFAVDAFVLLDDHRYSLYKNFCALPTLFVILRSLFVNLATSQLLESMGPMATNTLQFLVFSLISSPICVTCEFICDIVIIVSMVGILADSIDSNIDLLEALADMQQGKLRILSREVAHTSHRRRQ